jgi:peroxiredoxin
MMPEFRNAGAKLVAISADYVKENKELHEKHHFPFPILSDFDLKVLKQLGMVHEGANPKGTAAARPATYVVDRHGKIRWFHSSTNIRERPDPKAILAAVQQAK